jgi:hypothetical protein
MSIAYHRIILSYLYVIILSYLYVIILSYLYVIILSYLYVKFFYPFYKNVWFVYDSYVLACSICWNNIKNITINLNIYLLFTFFPHCYVYKSRPAKFACCLLLRFTRREIIVRGQSYFSRLPKY